MLRTAACGASLLVLACGGGAGNRSDAAVETGATPTDTSPGSDSSAAPDVEVDTRVDTGTPPPDVGHDGPPTAQSLQGGWYASVPVAGGAPPMFRRRFVDATYYQVTIAYQICAETGTFAVTPNGVSFSPGRAVGASTCVSGAARVEPIAWAGDGIAFGPAGSATVYWPIRSVPKLFPTPELHDGNLAGDAALAGTTAIAKADALCERSLGKPDGQAYKALLVDGVTRSAAPSVDWVLRPNTTYFRADGALNVFHTNGSALANPSANNAVEPSATFYVWTGLGFDFATQQSTCGKWTSAASTDYAGVAYSNSAMWTFASSVGVACNTPNAIWCVSQ
jgi:hypothetical protein